MSRGESQQGEGTAGSSSPCLQAGSAGGSGRLLICARRGDSDQAEHGVWAAGHAARTHQAGAGSENSKS